MNPMKITPDDSDLNQQAEELAALLDALTESGSQHINLNIGEQTKIQTVSSTECNPQLGPCAVPNFQEDEEE
jgi:pyruvate-formate lyase